MTEEEEGFESSAADVTPKPARARVKPPVVVGAGADPVAEARDAEHADKELWCFLPDLVDSHGNVIHDPTVEMMAERFDPENLIRWLRLENKIGTKAVKQIWQGGARAVGQLDAVEKAVGAELVRAQRTAAWLASGPLDAAELANVKGRLPLLTYNDEPWLPGGVVGLVVAGGGSGKTTWLAELAVRISHGIAWPDGLWQVSEACGPVLAVLAEEDRDGVAYQLRRACKAAGVQHADDVHIWAGAGQDTALGMVVTLNDPARGQISTVVPTRLHDTLCERARKLGPLLIVLDPVNKLLPGGGTENDAITAGGLINLAGEIQAAAEEGRKGKKGPRPVVLIAHHERKMAGDDAGASATRGSTAFVDNARWVCRIGSKRPQEGPHSTEWEVVKSNYTAQVTVKAHRSVESGAVVWAPLTPEHEQQIEEFLTTAAPAKPSSKADKPAKPAKADKPAKAYKPAPEME